jgi:hypothetical protein
MERLNSPANVAVGRLLIDMLLIRVYVPMITYATDPCNHKKQKDIHA